MSGDIRGQPDSDSEVIQEKLEDLKVRYGFREPERGNLDDPDIVWRFGKPDYTKANYQFLKSKTQNHAEGCELLLEMSFCFQRWSFQSLFIYITTKTGNMKVESIVVSSISLNTENLSA